MSTPTNKIKQAADIEAQVNEFLRNGGTIKRIPAGQTAVLPSGARSGVLTDEGSGMAEIQAEIDKAFRENTTAD